MTQYDVGNFMNGRLFLIVLMVMALVMVVETRTQGQDISNIDDIYDILDTKNYELAYTQCKWLVEHKGKDPVAYFQLGLISQMWMNELDPLKQFNDFSELADEASRVYYPLAIRYMKESMIAGNTVYLDSIRKRDDPDKLTINEYRCDLNMRISTIKQYLEHVDTVYKLLQKTVRYYNTCIDIYMTINRQEPSIKHLYMETADTTLASIKLLGECFDSTEHYFAKYKKALAEYPIANYNQVMKKRDIVVYRLDGISNTDFMQPEIIVWDFKKWVRSLNSIRGSDIKAIKNSLDVFNQQYSSAINQYETGRGYVALKTLDLPRTTRFVSLKYDYNSPAIALVDYFLVKKHLIVQANENIEKLQAVTRDLEAADILMSFNKTVTTYMACDSILKSLAVTRSSASRYYIFFKHHLGPDLALQPFQDHEETKNKSFVLQALGRFTAINPNEWASQRVARRNIPGFVFRADTGGGKNMFCDNIHVVGNMVYARGYDAQEGSGKTTWIALDTAGTVVNSNRLNGSPRHEILRVLEMNGIPCVVSNSGVGDSLITLATRGKKPEISTLLPGKKLELALENKLDNNILVVTNDSPVNNTRHHVSCVGSSLQPLWFSSVYVEGIIQAALPERDRILYLATAANQLVIISQDGNGNTTGQKTIALKHNISRVMIANNGDNTYAVAGTTNTGTSFYVKINKTLSQVLCQIE